MASPRYYYWDPAFRTEDGKTLQQCFDEFGTGVQQLPNDAKMEVIFLDDQRSFGNSWALRCYDRYSGVNVRMTSYEKDKVYGTHTLNPRRKTR